MLGRSCQVDATIAAILSSVALADPLHKQVKDFAAFLFVGVQIKHAIVYTETKLCN